MTDRDPLPERTPARILVVDDEEFTRRSLTDILKLEGYRVDGAADAAEAISALDHTIYDAILLDLRMPDESVKPGQKITNEQAGIKVLHHAGERAADTPVIFLTAHGSLETAIEALRCRALDYLLKPASPAQILAALENALLKRQELLQQHAQQAALDATRSLAGDMAQSLEKLESSLQALRSAAEPEGPLVPRLGPGQPPRAAAAEAQTPGVTLIELANGAVLDLARREVRQTAALSPGAAPALLRVSLTPGEGRLMQIFSENPGRVFSPQELVKRMHGYDSTALDAPEVLRPVISRLRHKLEAFPGGQRWIRSVRGAGYIFDIPQDY